MRLHARLDSPASQTAAVAVIAGLCGLLLYAVFCDFAVSAIGGRLIAVTPDAPLTSLITDPFEGGEVSPSVLAASVRYFANSARLHLKLAEFERYRPDSDDVSIAEYHALQAIRLSPYDYRPRLLMASIQSYKEDSAGAEKSLRAALELSPRNAEVQYVLATLLLTRGNVDEALEHFRAAISVYPPYLAGGLDRVWNETHGNPDCVKTITPEKSADQLRLARFFLDHARPIESAAVFRRIDRGWLLGQRDAALYLDTLIQAGHITLAHELWSGLLRKKEPENTIANGGFEDDILVGFAQFDWSIGESKYARVSIDGAVAHAGKRSLRIDFLGHETTRLEDEINQILLLRRGERYRLRYQIRTEGLNAPEGLQVVVTGKSSPQWIAASAPVAGGSNDWHDGKLEFTAPDDVLILAIKQRPKFSYEEPTHGTVWLDDFELHAEATAAN
jgi:tetratricopeptide (TPR) repeat protein